MKVIVNNDTNTPINVNRYERRFTSTFGSSTGALYSLSFFIVRPEYLDQFLSFKKYIPNLVTKIEVYDNGNEKMFEVNCTEARLENLTYSGSDIRDFQGEARFNIYEEAQAE